MGKDYYKLLGVGPNAGDDELKKAYRKSAIKWHPDKHTKDADKHKAEEMFKNIAEAYDVLSNKDTRQVYDTFGEEGLKRGATTTTTTSGGAGAGGAGAGGGGGGIYHGVDPSELFSKFFGSDRIFFSHGGAAREGERTTTTMDSFDDDFGGFPGFGGGTLRSIGRGLLPGANSTTAAAGSSTTPGTPVKRQQQPVSHEADLHVTLEELYTGTKKKLKITRKRYTNALPQQEPKILEVDVKPGWKDGTRIKFTGEGDQRSAGAPPGDLVFVVKSKQHPRFTRDGNHLIYKASVPLVKALTGFVVPIITLDGRRVEITMDDIVTHSTRKIVPGEGMPNQKRRNDKGDMILEFDIVYPRKLTGLQKQKIRETLE